MIHIRQSKYSTTRRSVLRSALAAPAIGTGLLTAGLPSRAFADTPTRGDIDILRFLAALEILETERARRKVRIGHPRYRSQSARPCRREGRGADRL
jgi:hypothetical protein